MNNTTNKPTIKLSYFKIVNSPAMIKQEAWRQKQIQKYYYDGRPLYGKYNPNFYR